MKLEFDSIDELHGFLCWAENYRSPTAGAQDVIDLSNTAVVRADSAGLNDADRKAIADAMVAVGTLPAGVDGGTRPPPVTGDPSGAALQPAGEAATEPTKRKRRTRAEIEADAATAASAAGADPKVAADASDKAAEGPTTPSGAKPFEQAAQPATDPAGTAPEDAAADAETVVTPFQHLTRAREFIAKHGMPKYNESFTKAGLDANVMGYSAYQRAVHMTALDALEAA